MFGVSVPSEVSRAFQQIQISLRNLEAALENSRKGSDESKALRAEIDRMQRSLRSLLSQPKPVSVTKKEKESYTFSGILQYPYVDDLEEVYVAELEPFHSEVDPVHSGLAPSFTDRLGEPVGAAGFSIGIQPMATTLLERLSLIHISEPTRPY